MKQTEIIADRYSRHESARYAERHWPEIMFRKNFNYEQVKWSCPLCGVDNFVRVHTHSTLEYQPIITPRVYYCHNTRCEIRRFYWRDEKNVLFARYLGKYEPINELEFTSGHDPVKFYSNLRLDNPFQTKIF